MPPKDATSDTRALLVSTHLYFDPGTRSLRTRAFGEIITKILFPDLQLHQREIVAQAAQIVGVSRLEKSDIQSGLDFLREKDAVINKSSLWSLKEKEVARFRADLEASGQREDRILDKHFGTKLDRQILRSWFRDAAISLFGEFGKVWAARIRRESTALPRPHEIQSLVATTIIEHDLKDHAAALTDGFAAFIGDYDDPDVQAQVWSFAQAMLAARFVRSAVGPDPLSVGEFRGSRMLLDTNVLFVAALEKNRLAPALTALAESVHEIGASFWITTETQQEYERVVARRREQVLRVADKYTPTILSKSRDPILKTAVARGCKTRDDFVTFFDSIASAPNQISTSKIEVLDNEDVEAAINKGKGDSRKQAQIAAEWRSQRPYDKPRQSVEHDASLDSVLDYLRGIGEKAWIISLDGPMQTLSARWAGPNPPAWIGIDTLIQILAVYSAGPGHRPENFAPLFSTIIKEDLQPGATVFTLEDLDALLDLEDRAGELRDEEVEIFAAKMRRLRMSGKSKNDAELQLEMRRTFQRKKIDTEGRIRSLEGEVAVTRQDKKAHQASAAANKEALVSTLYRSEWHKRIALITGGLILCLLIGIAISCSGFLLWNKGQKEIGLALIVGGIAEIILPVMRWIIPAFRQAQAKALAAAQDKAIELASVSDN